MKDLKNIGTLCFVFGLMAILIGWIKSWGLWTKDVGDSAWSAALIVGGVLLWVISAVIDRVIKAIKEQLEE